MESAVKYRPAERVSSAAVPFIRWMIRRDFPEVLAIENQSFDDPWDEEAFLRFMRRRNCIGMVAEIDGSIVGFMMYALHTRSIELVNFAVAADWRHQRVGTAMLDKFKDKLHPLRRNALKLEVRESNLPAQLFLQAAGFKATGVLRGHFELPDGRTEDAYKMRFVMGDGRCKE